MPQSDKSSAAQCCDKVYFCPTSGDTECPVHGGFDVCCDRPDLHRPVASAATPSPADTIRTALQGAMVGAWGRENALRALAEIEAENERLRREIESLRPHVEGIGYAG